MGLQLSNVFVNLPVKDLNKTKEFFAKIGFEFNAQFTDENAACMIIGENIFAMLLVENYFKSFTTKAIPDGLKTSEVIVSLSAANREQVDEICNKAISVGGKSLKDPVDHGFMYQWGFEDIDGHLWEFFYMDPSHIQ